MNWMITRTIRTSVLAVFLASMGHTISWASEPSAPREAIMNVSGEGEVAIVPDMAILRLGVVREAKLAADALRSNSDAMAKIMSALEKAGIEAKDMQTADFYISPRYRQASSGEQQPSPPVIEGYSVNNSLVVKIKDISKLGTIMDAAVNLGVNQGGNITFTNAAPEQAITKARKAAMADAISKAKTLADAAGVKLGRIISISEASPRPMEQTMMMKTEMVRHLPSAPVPISAGENTYSVTVNVSFDLKQ
ncbi:SIMPL domain-containing protein [Allorhizobium sp. BGMRC 0089]|uniref:SIMPL domain-containing protein n=1 Tax=Allorhizobium sonneratiae TaxID=2934936 RepID=UPI0020334A24|nr:SIMPL domain-containing protein [Allorhizobium sonneratiae]MCM2294157.1 SIMPL domain-containing protein [Allorhizobium sonneratiae]